MNHTGVANVDQATSRPLVLRRLPKSQNAALLFFESSLKCVCFCLIFDYHWTQILCEVEEQATCMPMSPGFLSNSGPLGIIYIFCLGGAHDSDANCILKGI